MRPSPVLIVAVLALLAVAAFFVDRWIVTDREAVIARVEGAFDAAKRNDWSAFADALDDGFEWKGKGKALAVEFVRHLAQTFPASAWRLSIGEVTIDGERANVRGNVSLAVPAAMSGSGSRWDGRVGLAKSGKTWKIVSVTDAEEETGG